MPWWCCPCICSSVVVGVVLGGGGGVIFVILLAASASSCGGLCGGGGGCCHHHFFCWCSYHHFRRQCFANSTAIRMCSGRDAGVRTAMLCPPSAGEQATPLCAVFGPHSPAVDAGLLAAWRRLPRHHDADGSGHVGTGGVGCPGLWAGNDFGKISVVTAPYLVLPGWRERNGGWAPGVIGRSASERMAAVSVMTGVTVLGFVTPVYQPGSEPPHSAHQPPQTIVPPQKVAGPLTNLSGDNLVGYVGLSMPWHLARLCLDGIAGRLPCIVRPVWQRLKA